MSRSLERPLCTSWGWQRAHVTADGLQADGLPTSKYPFVAAMVGINAMLPTASGFDKPLVIIPQVSPHEFMQAVMAASDKHYTIDRCALT